MTGRFGAWGKKELLNTRADSGVGLLRREWFPLAGGVHAQGERSKDFLTRRVEAGQRGGFYQRFPEITLGATVTWHQITFLHRRKICVLLQLFFKLSDFDQEKVFALTRWSFRLGWTLGQGAGLWQEGVTEDLLFYLLSGLPSLVAQNSVFLLTAVIWSLILNWIYVKWMKTWAEEWEKIFAKHIF